MLPRAHWLDLRGPTSKVREERKGEFRGEKGRRSPSPPFHIPGSANGHYSPGPQSTRQRPTSALAMRPPEFQPDPRLCSRSRSGRSATDKRFPVNSEFKITLRLIEPLRKFFNRMFYARIVIRNLYGPRHTGMTEVSQKSGVMFRTDHGSDDMTPSHPLPALIFTTVLYSASAFGAFFPRRRLIGMIHELRVNSVAIKKLRQKAARVTRA